MAGDDVAALTGLAINREGMRRTRCPAAPLRCAALAAMFACPAAGRRSDRCNNANSGNLAQLTLPAPVSSWTADQVKLFLREMGVAEAILHQFDNVKGEGGCGPAYTVWELSSGVGLAAAACGGPPSSLPAFPGAINVITELRPAWRPCRGFAAAAAAAAAAYRNN